MLVHPSTTNTPARREALHLLSRVLDITSPRGAKMHTVWTFGRKRKRRDEDDEEEVSNELINESLFNVTENVWDLIEWAFFQSQGGWIDLICLIVRILRNDFDENKNSMFPW